MSNEIAVSVINAVF